LRPCLSIYFVTQPNNVLYVLCSAFNRTWAIALEAKRAEEQAQDAAAKEHAAKEIADWHAQRQAKLNSNKEKNRSEEQVMLEKVEYELESGNSWERVTKLIDNDAEAESDKSDTLRMRKLFIQLKNEPLETSRGATATA
jgi:hypothetical protein